MAPSQSDLPLYRFRAFGAISGVVHGVSTRHGGVSRGSYSSLNLSLSVQDDANCVHENRGRLASAFRSEVAQMLTTRQVHGTDVVAVGNDSWSVEDSPRADALITDRYDVLLMQRFADCVPIILASTTSPAVGIAHAGWRGTINDVVGATVGAMVASYGVSAKDLVAGIGPSIGPCCFEVGMDVAEQFQNQSNVVLTRAPRPHVDLWEANRQMLLRAGLAPEAIEIASICTRCHSEDYFSHRGLGYPAGRFAGVVGLVA